MSAGSISSIFVPIHPEGHKFVIAFVAATALLFFIFPPLGWIGVILTVWCAYFFRDPVRTVPNIPGALISPADGVVQLVDQAPPPAELNMGDAPRTRIAVFMNVFNVHVNRAPAEGTITDMVYVPGKFVNASLDKASTDNERQVFRMTTGAGADVVFVQIAGLVARRIVSWIEKGDPVDAGERVGMIRFGSRVDIYLDENQKAMVIPGQIAVAGETVIADARFSEPQRSGITA